MSKGYIYLHQNYSFGTYFHQLFQPRTKMNASNLKFSLCSMVEEFRMESIAIPRANLSNGSEPPKGCNASI